jgi:hypothetical protein
VFPLWGRASARSCRGEARGPEPPPGRRRRCSNRVWKDGVRSGTLGALERPGLASARLPAPRLSATRPRVRLLCHRGRLTVARLLPVENFHPVGTAPPERPGGKLLWNLGTSPLRLRPPALAGGWTCTQRGSAARARAGASRGGSQGASGKSASHPSGPNGARQVEEQRDCTHLRSPPSPSRVPTRHLRYLDCLDYRKGVGVSRLERVVRPARESQLPLGYSQLPTAFSQPTAASVAGSLQLQAPSLDTPGVEGDGATFVGKKFRGYQWESNPGPRESKLPPYHPARLHTWTQTPSLLLTYRPQARPASAASPPGGSEGGPGGRWSPYCLRGHRGLPAATHLWAPRAATSVLCGKNVCQRRAICGHQKQPPRFFVERTRATASRLWTARAAVSVLCGKNLCPCFQVASHP